MAFERLKYGKSWERSEDFPTYEDSETQVRADLQYHPDAVRNYLNEVLIPALEGAGGAASLGSSGGTVQAVLDRCVEDIRALAAGGVPSVSQCVTVPFKQEDWHAPEEGEKYYTLTIGRETHKRSGTGFGYNLWHDVEGVLVNNTWGVAGTQVSVMDENGDITLRSRTPYDGIIVFFGV